MLRSSILLILLAHSCFLFAQNHRDCASAMSICKKQVYHIDKTGGSGADDGTDLTSCFMNGDNAGQAEENSTWIKFEVAKNGTLTFAITPHRLTDDIDFVVYLLPNGNCRDKQIVRCMAAGDDESAAMISPCMGETGLRDGEKDTSEDAGCNDTGDNTWLAPLRVEAGEQYIILVSNVSSSGPGFSIRFGGTCKLPCDDEPKPTPPVATIPSEKPQPAQEKTTPPKRTTDPVVTEKTEPGLPTTIGGRKVDINESLKVKGRRLTLRISDNQVEDGDVVSVYLNDKKVLDRVALYRKPKEFTIDLPADRKTHLITVYAEDFGLSGFANTALVEVFDGKSWQTIDLSATQSSQESVKITVE